MTRCLPFVEYAPYNERVFLERKGITTVNVYDFDETIFFGDSEDRFFQFMFKRKGYFWYKVNYKWNEFLLKLRILDKTTTRESEYSILKKINKVEDLDHLLEEYWDEVEQYMMPWYDTVKKEDDVIASGTPRFIMEPICRRLGVKGLVATEMDPKTGKVVHGMFAVQQYKLENFKEQYNTEDMDNFYSDAWSDHFMADVAKHAYMVYDGEKKMEWNEFFRLHPEKKVMPYRV